MEDFEKKNYYELLGLERDASSEQIKQAFKEIALVYHPDSNFFDEIVADAELPPEGNLLFKAITQAYNVLSNEEKRAAYDKTLTKKDLSEGINLTGEWIRPDGTSPQDARQVRVRTPTITNLQKLQKQYEETVNSQSKLNAASKVETIAELRSSRENDGLNSNKLLLIILVSVSLIVFLMIVLLV